MRALAEVLAMLFSFGAVGLIAKYTVLRPWLQERRLRAIERENARLDRLIESDRPRKKRR